MFARLKALWDFSNRLVETRNDDVQAAAIMRHAEEVRAVYNRPQGMATIVDMTPDNDFADELQAR